METQGELYRCGLCECEKPAEDFFPMRNVKRPVQYFCRLCTQKIRTSGRQVRRLGFGVRHIRATKKVFIICGGCDTERRQFDFTKFRTDEFDPTIHHCDICVDPSITLKECVICHKKHATTAVVWLKSRAHEDGLFPECKLCNRACNRISVYGNPVQRPNSIASDRLRYAKYFSAKAQ